ncbi:MAG: DUF86 domain-containing protein [bacterium]
MHEDKVFIHHIAEELNYLITATANLTYAELINDETKKRAVIRSLEVIGEATKNLSKEFRDSHSNIEWKDIAGLRDKLIHRYFGVDWDTVWDIIKNKIPYLSLKINEIIDKK